MIATFALVTRIAHAECPLPKPFITPPSGTHVPPNATAYVMLPAKYKHDAIDDRHRVTLIGDTDGFTLARVELADDLLSVWGERRMNAAKYTIDRDVAPRVEIVGVTRAGDNTLEVIAEGNAIALRFAWSDGGSTTIPFEYVKGRLHAQLGELTCIGWNIAREELARDRRFVVFAQFTDGSERELGASRMQLGDETLRVPTDLVGKRIAPPKPYLARR